MTAHDLATGTSWAVIDRPYNSDASRLQLPIGLIMISPTRLFCRVRSGHLKESVKATLGPLKATVNLLKQTNSGNARCTGIQYLLAIHCGDASDGQNRDFHGRHHNSQWLQADGLLAG